jgi:WD40 repeat protein
MCKRALLVASLVTTWVASASAQAPVLPPGDKQPLLRLEAGGPTSRVTALAFNADGTTLYAAGYDKVVRVWNLNAAGDWELDKVSYRVPIGPGIYGALNAVAVSPDGAWLATGGSGVVRVGSGFRNEGFVLPKQLWTQDIREDEGTVYLFKTADHEKVRPLRGHRGIINALEFAPSVTGAPPVLVSGGREWDMDKREYYGAVRVWDVTTGNLLATSPVALPDPVARLTGLAVRRIGPGARQLLVAIAWGDGKLRLWDLTTNTLREAADGRMNDTIAFLPGQPKLLTGSYEKNGWVQRWNAAPGQAPAADGRARGFVGDNGQALYPRALAVTPSRPRGPVDHAAVVVWQTNGGNKYWLHLLDLQDRGLGSVAVRQLPWEGVGEDVRPIVATAPNGGHVAVTGNTRNVIAVYAVDDLVRNRGEPKLLRSVGVSFREVTFLRKGDDFALQLRERSEAKELVFDFRGRRVLDTNTGWAPSRPNAAGWDVEETDVKPDGKTVRERRVQVRRGGQVVGTVRLNPAQEVKAWAILPARQGGLPATLLALGFLELGESKLFLFNAETGAPVRQLNGHVNAVRGLAFSGDGRLLASVGDDQQVCVWTLTDLPQVLGQKADLPGIGLYERSGRLQVTSVDRFHVPAANAGKLALGDTLVGLTVGGEVKPFARGKYFTTSLSDQNLKPGDTATLRVRDARNAERDVRIVLGQLTDERKPLFTLFVTRGQAGAERDWIGWSPYGFFDSSGPEAERQVGWHFNTGNPDAPTSFGLMAEYRKEYYRSDLLAALVKAGNRDDALKILPPPAPPAKPKLTTWLDDDEARAAERSQVRDGKGYVEVRKPPQKLRLQIDNLPAATEIEAVEWQVNDGVNEGQWRSFPESAESERVADLSKQEWKPGLYTLRARLRLKRGDDKVFVEELPVRYQNPAPTVEFAAGQANAGQESADFTLRATVHPGAPGQAFTVKVTHRHAGKVLDTKEPKSEQGRPLEVAEAFKLREGENRFDVEMENSNALPGFEDRERSGDGIVVRYTPPKPVPAPVLALERYEQLHDPKALGVPGHEELHDPKSTAVQHPVPSNRRLTVRAPYVGLTGKITAQEALASADWQAWDEAKNAAVLGSAARPLTDFAARRELTFSEALKLQPGKQHFRFRAQTKTSPPGTVDLEVFYQPQLPGLELGKVPTELVEGPDKPEVTLTGRLTPVRDPHPFEVVIQRNGQPVQVKTELKGLDWKAVVPLDPGVNELRVIVRNQWGAVQPLPDVLKVELRRTPVIEELKGPDESNDPLVNLTAKIQSPTPLTPDQIEARVGDRVVTGKVEVAAVGNNRYAVTINGVSLDRQGPNQVEVYARNQDGRSRQPGRWKVNFTAKGEPPGVEVVNVKDDTTVPDPEFPIHLRVRSKRELKRLELVSSGRFPRTYTVDVSQLQRDAAGVYDVTTKVDLDPGDNPFVVRAWNDQGPSPEALARVNYVQLPVRIRFDSLDTGKDGKTVPVRYTAEGRPILDDVPTGRVTLHGRILLDKVNDELVKQLSYARVYVNGFQQLPAVLDPPSRDRPRERTFRCTLVLSRDKHNEIQVQLPDGMKDNAGNRLDFVVDCKEPMRGKRLHLLILGVGPQDEKLLEEQLMRALNGNNASNIQAAFEQIKIHGILTGENVRRRMVMAYLRDIKNYIERQKQSELRAMAGSPHNDLIMVYYQGGEAIDRERFLQTDAAQTGRQVVQGGLSVKELNRILADTPGAQLMMLDVARAGGRATAQRPERADAPELRRVGLLSSSWLNPRADAPADARLTEGLEEAMSRGVVLRDVVSYLKNQFGPRVSSRYPNFYELETSVPPVLMDLVIGLPQKSPSPKR